MELFKVSLTWLVSLVTTLLRLSSMETLTVLMFVEDGVSLGPGPKAS